MKRTENKYQERRGTVYNGLRMRFIGIWRLLTSDEVFLITVVKRRGKGEEEKQDAYVIGNLGICEAHAITDTLHDNAHEMDSFVSTCKEIIQEN